MSKTLVPRGDLERRMGERFKELRREHKIWLEPLAKALGVSINTIRWHEAGVRSMRSDLIVRAAEIIGVPAGELVLSQPKKKRAPNAS
jgi:transcriptional regulator with XRE-family HTH domain